MALIKIEGGTEKLVGHPEGTYRYIRSTNEGIFSIVFLAAPGEVPEVGDFIDPVGKVLVKRQGYQINDDTSRWETQPKDYWGE